MKSACFARLHHQARRVLRIQRLVLHRDGVDRDALRLHAPARTSRSSAHRRHSIPACSAPPLALLLVFIHDGAVHGEARILIFGLSFRISFITGITSARSGPEIEVAHLRIGLPVGHVVVGEDALVQVGCADSQPQVADADARARRCRTVLAGWRRGGRHSCGSDAARCRRSARSQSRRWSGTSASRPPRWWDCPCCRGAAAGGAFCRSNSADLSGLVSQTSARALLAAGKHDAIARAIAIRASFTAASVPREAGAHRVQRSARGNEQRLAVRAAEDQLRRAAPAPRWCRSGRPAGSYTQICPAAM